jgi:phage baseplate assembly protein W
VDNQSNKQEQHFLGSGWSFPVRFSAGSAELNLSKYEENINESINIILLTNKGERCMEENFGSGLQRFFFRKMDETLRGDIKDAVQNTLLHNEPRITVNDVNVEYQDVLSGLVKVLINYTYNLTNTRHNYVFPFYVKEGTNL